MYHKELLLIIVLQEDYEGEDWIMDHKILDQTPFWMLQLLAPLPFYVIDFSVCVSGICGTMQEKEHYSN